MRGIQELATVLAKIFEPGATCGYHQLLAEETALWHVADPTAATVWDAVTDPDISGGIATFEKRAILITLLPVPSANDRKPVTLSHLGAASFGGHDYADLFDAAQVQRMADVILRRYADDAERRCIEFLGVFDVILTPSADPVDRYRQCVEFLGELDLSTPLTLSTAALEMDILRMMGEGQYLHQHAIMNCLFGQGPRPDMWVLRHALDQLVAARLLDLSPDQLPARYTLSAKGKALRA